MDMMTMDPFGSDYSLGDMIENVYFPADDCDDILEEMLRDLSKESKTNYEIRRKIGNEGTIERDLVPLMIQYQDTDTFYKATRVLTILSQPLATVPASAFLAIEMANMASSLKHSCTNSNFFKALAGHMKAALAQSQLEEPQRLFLGHCLMLVRNLLHMGENSHQDGLLHQCLLSSFFMSQLDQVLLNMLNHKMKETWTIETCQLLSFMFKSYSGSLLESVEEMASITSDSQYHTNEEELNVENDPDSKLKLQWKADSATDTLTSGSSFESDDEFMVKFKLGEDGKMELKMAPAPECVSEETPSLNTNFRRFSLENNEESFEEKPFCMTRQEEVTDENVEGVKEEEEDVKEEEEEEEEEDTEDLAQRDPSSLLMDYDILISYLRKFAKDILSGGLVDLVENIMRCLLGRHMQLNESFLMWTIGFFMNFADQQEMGFDVIKGLLNLDLYSYMVYQSVVSCEAVAVKVDMGQDASQEKHRLHLVVCTLNQMFRATLAHSKTEGMHHLLNNLGRIKQLRNMFVLLIGQYQSHDQNIIYLRDLVQTNHVLMLILEEMLAQGIVGEHMGFKMVDHVQQFASREMMAKYGSLLEDDTQLRSEVNMPVMTMMYHVAGDCAGQEHLMQMPIVHAFYNFWARDAVHKDDEMRDLVDFILELFMSSVESDPMTCAKNLLEELEVEAEKERGGPSKADFNSDKCIKASPRQPEAFTEEEESLIFSWLDDIDSPDMVARLVRALAEHGFARSHDEVTQFLVDNNFMDAPPSAQNTETATDKVTDAPTKAEISDGEFMTRVSTMTLGQATPLLVARLTQRGMTGPLAWLRAEMLELAYVKLSMKDPILRRQVPEPVPMFYALQKMPVPLVAWNQETQNAVADPMFQALMTSLGLVSPCVGVILFPRVPTGMSAPALVQAAGKIAPIDPLSLKFELMAMKPDTNSEMDPPPPRQAPAVQNKGNARPIKQMSSDWLSFVRMNKKINMKKNGAHISGNLTHRV